MQSRSFFPWISFSAALQILALIHFTDSPRLCKAKNVQKGPANRYLIANLGRYGGNTDIPTPQAHNVKKSGLLSLDLLVLFLLTQTNECSKQEIGGILELSVTRSGTSRVAGGAKPAL